MPQAQDSPDLVPALRRRQLLQAGCGALALVGPGAAVASTAGPVQLPSLATLELGSLRERVLDARFERLQAPAGASGSTMLAYRSEGLRLYARLVLPAAGRSAPARGWPVLLWAHGWVGADKAAGWHFDTATGSLGDEVVRRFAEAGHAVVVPGFRGHGTVAGQAAEGLAWVRAFDNGSYLSPLLYTIDLLHALQALPTLADALPGARVDLSGIAVGGYSQGGDVALAALAVASSPRRALRLRAGVVWAGCFAGRLEQARFYGGMEASAEARRDPAFFPHMPSWWTPGMYRGSIAEGIARKHAQLIETVRRHVADAGVPSLQALAPQLARLDAWSQPELIQAPLQLHYSDQDHYSPPQWNEPLAQAVLAAGGRAEAHLYRGNTHGFGVDPGWSPKEAVAGRALSIDRALAFVGRATTLRSSSLPLEVRPS